MGISSKEVREVEFRERMRGYHQEDVDEFLEQVARGIEVLEEQLREARAELASGSSHGSQSETPIAPPVAVPPPVEYPADDVIQRTLILAQRTADQVVAEARGQSETMRSEAKAQAAQIIETAQAQATALANERAKHVAEEVEALESRRADLLSQLSELSSSTRSLRDGLKASLARLMSEVENALVFEYSPALSDERSTGQEIEAPSASESEGISPDDSAFDSEELGEAEPERGAFEDADAADNTMVFPQPVDVAPVNVPPAEPDFTFGRPSFQLLDGDGPSAPVLFDDEEQR